MFNKIVSMGENTKVRKGKKGTKNACTHIKHMSRLGVCFHVLVGTPPIKTINNLT